MFYAHTEDQRGEKEPVIDHLIEVARLAKDFASVWGAGAEGEASGLLHDLGKYSEAFQKVLKGEEKGIDHATPGALAILKKYKNHGVAAALTAQGHHDGLQIGYHRELQSRLMMKEEKSALGKRYASRDVELLLKRFLDDGGKFPELAQSSYVDEYFNNHYISAMLYVRMLFSALTDADYLATEAHFNKTSEKMAYREHGEQLSADIAFQALSKYKEEISKNSKANSKVNVLRDDLYNACVEAGIGDPGIFTLTAPTGAGKTLAMLAFALKHAQANGMRRIIIVLPFLNIIEQTANVYKKIFHQISDKTYVLEDHSLTEWSDDGYARLLAENWDAPIVITTTVKFFEALFAYRSSICRRLHNISKSVIIFDEAQTMPPNLVVPTLAALSELCRRFESTVVFSTATQPAFDYLDDHIKPLAAGGWSPREIVSHQLNLFERARRTRAIWHKERLSWDDLAEQIIKSEQTLTIVNLRRHAKEIYSRLQEIPCDYKFHLSTDMCPAHRIDILDKVKKRLENNAHCCLISTQCVEAGVDLDFPVVWRAMAPLDAIIQAAGRCNRNGNGNGNSHLGDVHVFLPSIEEELYPVSCYANATAELKGMLQQKDIDISDPDTIREYYMRVFQNSRIGTMDEKLRDAIAIHDYSEVSKLYRWIPERTVNVLVPYEPQIESFNELCNEARQGRITKRWLDQARMLSVGVYLNRNNPIMDFLEPIQVGKQENTGWYILVNHQAYSNEVGIDLSSIETESFYMA